MRRALLFLGLLSTLGGCTQIALRNDTARTTNTLTDLQFQQVLDNVARFHDSPDTVPSFAVATSGTVSVLDQTSAGVSPTYSPTVTFAQQIGSGLPILSLLFPVTAQRSVTENWSLLPITDATNLRHLRCAYRLLVLGETAPDYDLCVKQIKEFFEGDEPALSDSFPPRGWYGVGCKKAVPKNACYVGRHSCTYVWVMPEGMNGLAVFTIGALDLATGKSRTPMRTVVRKYKGEPKAGNLVETQVTTTEEDESAIAAQRKGQARPLERPRVTETPRFNPGLLLQPRP
jgi:hypothetical protein